MENKLAQPDSLEGQTSVKPKATTSKRRPTRHLINVYSVSFVLLVSALSVFIFWYWQYQNTNQQASSSIPTTTLNQQNIEDLRNNTFNIGDPSQSLNISSNTTINGHLTVKDSVDIAGSLNVSGTINLPGIDVSGSSKFEELNISGRTAIGGELSVQGQISSASSLNILGNGSFGGTLSASQISVNNLQLQGDLAINRHIITTGSIPTIVAGSNIGVGGTVSITGTDSAGTVNINTGNSPSIGNLATITFAINYQKIPRIIISPIGSSAGALGYYITRSESGYVISTTSSPLPNANIVFDYFVIQ